MADFDFITPRLGTGGAVYSPADVDQIAGAGFTHVLDVTDSGDDTPLFANNPNVVVCWNPTADDGQPKPADWFGRSFIFALPAFSIYNAKIYAHCSAGINRGPSTAYAILRALGWSPVAAESLIRDARPQVGLAYIRDADIAVKAYGMA